MLSAPLSESSSGLPADLSVKAVGDDGAVLDHEQNDTPVSSSHLYIPTSICSMVEEQILTEVSVPIQPCLGRIRRFLARFFGRRGGRVSGSV